MSDYYHTEGIKLSTIVWVWSVVSSDTARVNDRQMAEDPSGNVARPLANEPVIFELIRIRLNCLTSNAGHVT